MKQALSFRGGFSSFLGPANFPIATQDEEDGNLYAENNGTGGYRGGEGLDALVLRILGTSSAARGRGRGRLLAGEDNRAGGRHGASAHGGATWDGVQGCRQWVVVIAAEGEFRRPGP